MTRWWMLAALTAGATMAAEVAAGPYGYFPWHFIPGFDLVYGFVGCVAIVLVSKAAGKWFIQRDDPDARAAAEAAGRDGRA